MLSSIEGCTGDHGVRTCDEDEPIYISIAVLNHEQRTFLLTLFSAEQSKIYSHDQILNTSSLRLRPLTDDTKTAATPDEFLSSRLQTSTFSSATAEFIKSWIRECQTTHMFCGADFYGLLHGSDQSPIHPRRLLDLEAFQSSESIKLIEVKDDEKLEYCALSYSWGFSKPYVMTLANLSDFRKEINVNDLPKLLRDAVEVIRGIGFRYLWIDALCIMQDGHSSPAASDDWLDQAGKMNDIFGNSVITIAASEAFDGNQSLILPRNPLSHTVCRLDSDTNIGYEVVPTCTPYCLLHTFDRARYHLDTRAWVFQERILSPRTVHITRNFIHLECRTELKCEAMSRADDCHHSGAVAKGDYHTLFSMFGLGGLHDTASELFLNYWHELMRQYSTTNLSRSQDLLVALAGLANQVQRQSRLTWSFGLCREYLLRDMLWYVRGGMGAPCRERAPTWSWASIEVRGPQIMYEASTNVSLLANVTTLPEISDFARKPPLSGSVSRHSVKIAGSLKPGTPQAINPGAEDPSNMGLTPSHSITTQLYCQGMLEIHPKCPFHPDYEVPKNTELYSLLVARASGTQRRIPIIESWVTEVGLVLTPVVGHRNQYQRVGYFHYDRQRAMDNGVHKQLPSLFDESNIQEIEII